MKINSLISILITSIIFLGGCKSPQEKLVDNALNKTHEAVTPNIQTASWAQSWWMKRHNQILDRKDKQESDLIFIGNSIIHHWEDTGIESWNSYFGKYNPINMGFGGDQTQHVLWRMDNGELDGIKPKLAIVMIGTNNASAGHSAEMIADGVTTIISRIRTKLPDTRILLLAILPRDDFKSTNREINNNASHIFSNLADNKYIFFKNINAIFLDDEGNIPDDIMPDKLHPSPSGYFLWAEEIEEIISKLIEKAPSN